MYTIGIREWNWLEDNPALKVSKPKEPRGRVRFLSEEERERLLKSCKETRGLYFGEVPNELTSRYARLLLGE